MIIKFGSTRLFSRLGYACLTNGQNFSIRTKPFLDLAGGVLNPGHFLSHFAEKHRDRTFRIQIRFLNVFKKADFKCYVRGTLFRKVYLNIRIQN